MKIPSPHTLRDTDVAVQRYIALAVVVIGSFLWLYHDVITKLITDWSVDENYSHGYLVFPLALYFAWERRKEFASTRWRPNVFGFVVVIASLSLLVFGVLGAEVFTTEMSLIGTIAGSVLFLFGWRALKVLLFPIAFLVLMVPIPAIVFNQIAFPLQLLASRFAETVLMSFEIPVLREGNVIVLANTSLEVAEACSGIRSLISLLTLGLVYGYFLEARTGIRVFLALATAPVAIIANGLRVAGTGVASHYWGPKMAEGFFHTFSGWLVFIVSVAMLVALHQVVIWITLKKQVRPAPIIEDLTCSPKSH